MSDEDDFLSRWSRRKRHVALEETSSVPDKPEEPEAEPDTEPESEEEAALLLKLGLPRPESLGPGDDFKAFMAEGVPQFLRLRALRVLWRSNPVLANLDGLNDYDADFTAPELTKKILATSYRVGRGFVTQAMNAAAPGEPREDTAPPVAEVSGSQDELPDEMVEPHSTEAVAETEQPAPRPRRMRFET